MTQDAQGKTAKIYQFPVGGQAGLAATREPSKRVEAPRTARAARIVYGSSWYHGEAIIDEAAQPPRNR